MAGKPGRPRSLTLDQIAQAALDDGLAAFSMPSVARRVGVAHSALYRYVRDREDLLMASIERALDTVVWPDPDHAWDDLLRAIGDTVWQLCETFPGFERATLNSPRTSPAWLEHFREYAASLVRQGFSDDDASITIDLVMRLALYGSNEMYRIGLASKHAEQHGEPFDLPEVWNGRGFYDRQLEMLLAGAATLRTT